MSEINLSIQDLSVEQLILALRRNLERSTSVYVPTRSGVARRLGVAPRTLHKMIHASKDFPVRRVVPGIETPVFVWEEVRAWALKQPKEFE